MRKIILICLIIIVLVRCLFGIYVKEKYIYIPNEEKEYIKIETFDPTIGMPKPKSIIEIILQEICWITLGPFEIQYFTTKIKPSTKSNFVIGTNGELYMVEEHPKKENVLVKKYLKTLSNQELVEIENNIETGKISPEKFEFLSTYYISSRYVKITLKGQEYTYHGTSGYKVMENYIGSK